jgi:putative photosynthetic complex assembly protein
MNGPQFKAHGDLAFPRQVLWAAAGLVLFALVGTVAVRVGLLPQVANPQAMRADAQVAVLQSRDLLFLDEGGNVVVKDMDGGTVAVIRPESEQGFVRGVMRGLARERRLHGTVADTPFRLQLWADGGLTLTDLATSRQIELGGFGPTNRAAFAQMLEEQG